MKTKKPQGKKVDMFCVRVEEYCGHGVNLHIYDCKFCTKKEEPQPECSCHFCHGCTSPIDIECFFSCKHCQPPKEKELTNEDLDKANISLLDPNEPCFYNSKWCDNPKHKHKHEESPKESCNCCVRTTTLPEECKVMSNDGKHCKHCPLFKEKKESWRDTVTIMNSAWIARLTKLGEITVKSRTGFVAWENPELIPFIEKQIAKEYDRGFQNAVNQFEKVNRLRIDNALKKKVKKKR